MVKPPSGAYPMFPDMYVKVMDNGDSKICIEQDATSFYNRKSAQNFIESLSLDNMLELSILSEEEIRNMGILKSIMSS